MNSAQIRQSFLDFFESKQHKIVPSAPLLPSSPNLLFTNAGMNPFVPYFLGEREAPVKRIADTQKCIRAGGKHNDLDDVGYDTYHQTFFEMLGNWSIGDYFKQEAIEWAWELLTTVWGFPKERLYVTVYKPGDGDPAEFDQEAYDYWKVILEAEGLNPEERILTGGKKDNFWMMGDTGPCGPCSEIHIDLTPNGDTAGKLVNEDSPFCIEIWNLVFIQFSALEDGTFEPLAAQHIDTGMGFERVAGIVATTKNFTDFTQPPSNYNSDLFTPIFKVIEDLSGVTYQATLPEDPKNPIDVEMNDIIFRVLGDHIRTLCCSIADGILPGNEGRNYVLRRILRRAVMYGRRLNLQPGFFTKLVDPVLEVLGPVFPELQDQAAVLRKVIEGEEKSFDRTIDRGIQLFEKLAAEGDHAVKGEDAFLLYDTYGFPLDLTEILAEERGMHVDVAGFEDLLRQQQERSRRGQVTTVIKVAEGESGEETEFVGYERNTWNDFSATVHSVSTQDGKSFVVTDRTPFYAEMGGQVGDKGSINGSLSIVDTQKDGAGRVLHVVDGDVDLSEGDSVTLSIDVPNRLAIQRHHTATHVLHWALRKVLGTHIRQAGSFVGPDRLRFDFNHFEQVSETQLQEIEALCNEQLLGNDGVKWFDVPFEDKPEDVIAFFGEKYGNVVRVVDLGGWSKELCGGTHVEAAGEIGQIRIVSESSISAGVRRIEAVAGTAAAELTRNEHGLLARMAGSLSVKSVDAPARLQVMSDKLRDLEREIKELKADAARQAAGDLTSQVVDVNGVPVLAAVLDGVDANGLREAMDSARNQLASGVIVLGTAAGGKVFLNASVSKDLLERGVHAGKLLGPLAKLCGGGGGGKPDRAQAGGKDASKLPEAIAQVVELVSGQLG